jgi:hypothetical protein
LATTVTPATANDDFEFTVVLIAQHALDWRMAQDFGSDGASPDAGVPDVTADAVAASSPRDLSDPYAAESLSIADLSKTEIDRAGEYFKDEWRDDLGSSAERTMMAAASAGLQPDGFIRHAMTNGGIKLGDLAAEVVTRRAELGDGYTADHQQADKQTLGRIVGMMQEPLGRLDRFRSRALDEAVTGVEHRVKIYAGFVNGLIENNEGAKAEYVKCATAQR